MGKQHEVTEEASTNNVLAEVQKAYGDDARRLLVNYLQLTDEAKHVVLNNIIMCTNSVYGVSRQEVWEHRNI